MRLTTASRMLGEHSNYFSILKHYHPKIMDIVQYKGTNGNIVEGMRRLRSDVSQAKIDLQEIYFEFQEKRNISKLYEYMVRNNIPTGFQRLESFHTFMRLTVFNMDTRIVSFVKIIYLRNTLENIMVDFKGSLKSDHQ